MKKNLGRVLRFRRNHESVALPSLTPPRTAALPSTPLAARAAGWRGRSWLFLLVLLAGSSAVSFVAFKYVIPAIVAPSIPPELVGTWQVMDGHLQGATLQFSWYGTATAILSKQGKTETTQSSVKLAGRVLLLTTRDADTGKDETLTQTILTLTDNELVIQDEDRHVYRLKRLHG